MERVGVIGLGRMGGVVARHLLRAGHAVLARDIDPGAVAEAVGHGATACASPREVAERSELTLVAVGFGSEVESLCHGPDGFFAGARPGTVLAILSTVEADLVRALAREGEPRGVAVVDAPMIRADAIERGGLLLLTGGSEEVLARIDPVLHCFATDVVRLGPVGSGQVGKALNNFLLWTCTSADDNALKLARAQGLDQEAVRRALLLGTGANAPLERWAIQHDMPWAEKDMTIVMEMADEVRLSLPLAGVVREVIKAVKHERGYATPRPTGERPA